MKTKEIQEAICKAEVLKFNTPCENVSFIFGGESDVLSINKSGFITEFEVKISRSDFKADAKKVTKWKRYELKIESSVPNYFYYACPPELIQVFEVSDYAGLIWVSEKGVEVKKSASFIHKHKHDKLKILERFSRIMTERKYLGACRLTYENNKLRERRNKTVLINDPLFGTELQTL